MGMKSTAQLASLLFFATQRTSWKLGLTSKTAEDLELHVVKLKTILENASLAQAARKKPDRDIPKAEPHSRYSLQNSKEMLPQAFVSHDMLFCIPG